MCVGAAPLTVIPMSEQLYYPLPLSTVTEWPGKRGHVGTDFACDIGTELLACFDGVVTYVGDDGLGGMTVDITRADGLTARYGHMSEYRVKVGDRVRAMKTVLGLSGNTGYSFGPHLHWELRWDRLWNGGLWVWPQDVGAKVYTPASVKKLDSVVVRKRKRENRMFIYLKDGAGKGKAEYAVFTPGVKGSWVQFNGQESAHQLATQLGNAMRVWPGKWNELKERHQ